jgi:DNA-binding transcriptional ArsR family regulator
MSFARALEEDRRLAILRLLSEAPGYSVNSSVLQAALQAFAHRVSRDRVHGDLAWLREQGLITIEEFDSVVVATLSARGLDVAEGAADHPGVKRPAPK